MTAKSTIRFPATIPAGMTFAVVAVLCMVLVATAIMVGDSAKTAFRSSLGASAPNLDRAGPRPVRSFFVAAGGKP